ncbi:hypothetical protein COO60DRAFT_338225 [Scenedesmus sp. NREL 46B-D3]|nr:hypothetical protein COO60DRAFT_338225 [Scenedesmus sp. NREL 46B-D3]
MMRSSWYGTYSRKLYLPAAKQAGRHSSARSCRIERCQQRHTMGAMHAPTQGVCEQALRRLHDAWSNTSVLLLIGAAYFNPQHSAAQSVVHVPPWTWSVANCLQERSAAATAGQLAGSLAGFLAGTAIPQACCTCAVCCCAPHRSHSVALRLAPEHVRGWVLFARRGLGMEEAPQAGGRRRHVELTAEHALQRTAGPRRGTRSRAGRTAVLRCTV